MSGGSEFRKKLILMPKFRKFEMPKKTVPNTEKKVVFYEEPILKQCGNVLPAKMAFFLFDLKTVQGSKFQGLLIYFLRYQLE